MKKKIAKYLFHLFGYSVLLVSAAHQLYAFYLIQVQDVAVFMVQEPNLTIRYSEIALSIFGVVFGVYLFVSWRLNHTHQSSNP